MDETYLIEQAQGGDVSAYNTLVLHYQDAVYNVAYRIMSEPDAAALDEIVENYESSPLLISQDEPGPEKQSQQAELVEAIRRCLEGLPDDQRVAAVLCDVEGYDYREIANIMSSSLGTVKSRLSRARAKLRDCLQGSAELLPAGYRY